MAGSATYSSSDTWISPFTGTIDYQLCAPGGNGADQDGTNGGGGGGGGCYLQVSAYPVTFGTSYAIVVGDPTYFDLNDSRVNHGGDASGTSGGSGGSGSNGGLGTPGTLRTGGSGGNGGAGTEGGGGGAGGFNAGNGGDGSSGNVASPGTGGVGGSGQGGNGNGGAPPLNGYDAAPGYAGGGGGGGGILNPGPGSGGTGSIGLYWTWPTPTITSLDNPGGTTSGGTAIVITGTNFSTGCTVTVGGVSCTAVVVNSATQIHCTTGAHGAGAADVVVTNPDASNSGTLSNGFEYVAAGGGMKINRGTSGGCQ